MAAEKHWKQLEPWLFGSEGADGEHRMYCPLCEDPATSTSPSASANRQTGVWHCFSCKSGGGIPALVRQIKQGTRTPKADKSAAEYDPFPWYDGDNTADLIDLEEQREKRQNGYVERISEARVLGYVERLKEAPSKLRYLMEERGLEQSTITKYKIGYDDQRSRYTFPVYDEDGNLVNIRRYLPEGGKGEKMRNAAGHGNPPRLYPTQNLHDTDEAWVVEGEFDALLNTQNGFPSVTGTHGAGTWESAWSKSFAGKRVYICFDNDKEGRVGARKAGRHLLRYAEEVWIVKVPVDEEHGDLSDFWVNGGTKAQLKQAQRQAERVVPRVEEKAESSSEALAVPVQVIGSMDSRTNGKPLEMNVTITGKRDPTYSVPHKALLECTMDAGPKCKVCPMLIEHEGDVEVTIKPTDVETISHFVDANEIAVTDVLRKYVGAVKCNRFEWSPVENISVEELFVMGSVDRRGDHEESDYTQRRIYNVGSHETRTNMAVKVVGTTVPNRKDRRNEFFSWKLEESVTSIDKFEMTEELKEALAIFNPKPGQTPIERCRDIAHDLSDNVTRIVGRERLHMCIDLVFHSVLHFPLDDKIISRGWLEFLVVGDTRTGKSETAKHLSEYYGLGHIVGCEGATFAGLVGAVKQVADAWVVQWGEITVNDRRLVVLDEASGLSTDIISQMSDIRSRGIAQLTKAQSGQTRARCRLVWISNPRKGKFIDEKKYDGIDILEDLIGNPEDIARFDLAMSVSQSDVPNEKINRPDRRKVPHVFKEDLCRNLILWAWSRRPEQVIWDDDAYRGVYKAAEWLGKRYVDSPPLVQRTNVREKIARLAVALAARTFSTDATGELVCVKLDHVKGAMYFLDELYSYDNFGYLRLSQRIQRNRRVAKRHRTAIMKWLTEHPRLLDFLIDRRGSFRAQDLEEFAHMQREEANYCLGKLAEAKMISKSKSQILLEPELHDLLREMEKK